MRLPPKLIVPAVFAGAAALAALAAVWGAGVIEERSAAAVRARLLTEGADFAAVAADGLQVILTGTAPNEAARFRAVNLAGSVVDPARVADRLEVTPVQAIEAPRFSVEMLRNDDGLSLIGLLPRDEQSAGLAEAARGLAGGMQVADMLETADFPPPEGWGAALDFALDALEILPRSKISVAADRVSITAISGSAEEKRRLEGQVLRLAPEGLELVLNISAPRPVLTPFTLRFVRDAEGARFDACSADTERARAQILAAGRQAGATVDPSCTVGLGAPSPRWAQAVEAALRAVSALGAGTVTFSDTDVTLEAAPGTPRDVFDRVAGELEAALPPVFSLDATLPEATAEVGAGPAEFTATLSAEGQVEIAGRVTDEFTRKAVDSFARAQFGTSKVEGATRLDPALPEGWPSRVLAAIEALGVLNEGRALVRADTVEVTGVAGSRQASDRISQILSAKLGQGRTFKVAVRYDAKLDPDAALPTPEECMTRIGRVLAAQKIAFEPGSAEIDQSARATLDGLAEILKQCKGLRIEIAGHTDSQGSGGGNRALSQARAEAVLMALQGRRVDVSGMRAVGYGEDRPIADNRDEAGRETNRRIEFTRLGEDGAQVAGPVGATEPSFAPKEMTLRPKRRPDKE